jgi:hypothetical protein
VRVIEACEYAQMLGPLAQAAPSMVKARNQEGPAIAGAGPPNMPDGLAKLSLSLALPIWKCANLAIFGFAHGLSLRCNKLQRRLIWVKLGQRYRL